MFSNLPEQIQSSLYGFLGQACILTVTNAQGVILYANEAFSRISGYPKNKLVGQNHRILKSGVHSPEFYQQLWKTVTRGNTWRGNICNRTRSGSLYWVDSTVSPLRDKSGKITHYVALRIDITERQQMEEALRQQMEEALRQKTALFEAHIESSPDGILVVDAQGNKLIQNERLNELWKIPPHVAKNPSNAPQLKLALQRLKNPEKGTAEIARLDQPSETVIHSEIELADGTILDRYTAPVFGKNSHYYGRLWVFRDITERKRREEVLREKTAQFEAQVENSPDGILVVDSHGRKIIQNQRLNEQWDIPSDIATNPDNALQTEFVAKKTQNPAEFLTRIAWLEAHSKEIGHDEIELSDGTVLDRYSVPMRDKEGHYYGRLWTYRDITKQRRSEQQQAALKEQLRQVQKLEALGTFASGIAHDFNNILSVLMVNRELALMNLHQPEFLRPILNDIGLANDRARSLVHQILTFSQRQPSKRSPQLLQPIVQEALDLVRSSLPSSIEIHRQFSADMPAVLVDSTQIYQIVMNLCINAGHAMRGQPGHLTVKITHLAADQVLSEEFAEFIPNGLVELVISDTGCGMEPEVLARIFDPFFTTKGPNEGTGLGLAVVYGIVKEHGGNIAVHSQPGVGTTFKILFPAIAEPDAALVENTSIVAGEGECILVVDDEAGIGQALGEMLREIGYRTEICSDSRAALERIRSNPGAFDLLLTDYTMPHMTGTELAAQARTLRASLPVVMMSGLTMQARNDRDAKGDSYEVLAKPFDIASLTLALRKALKVGPV